MDVTPHFRVPLNLAHAATVADRILGVLRRYPTTLASETAFRIYEKLPGSDVEDLALRDEVAALARQLVAELHEFGPTGDRLGQCVRNLFECLELGEEGARLSLLAGEDPSSMQRPV